MKDKINFKVFFIILIAIQIFTFVYFSIIINNLKDDIAETKENINNKLLDVENKDVELQNNINQLSSSLTLTKESFTETQSTLVNPEMIEKVTKSVVSIKTERAQGTGFIITNDCYLVTNQHVIFNSGDFMNAITSNQEIKPLTLIGSNYKLDIALLKMSGNCSSLEFENLDNVKVGENVIAIGNPFGLSSSVTEGVISSISRQREETYYDSDYNYIQTDTALNPGNSGGPLLNTKGKVIGINNFKFYGADNIGFALESDAIIESVNEIALNRLNKKLI